MLLIGMSGTGVNSARRCGVRSSSCIRSCGYHGTVTIYIGAMDIGLPNGTLPEVAFRF